MRDLTGKVAVVTGAASGIGRALAQCLGRERMKVVLADIEKSSLDTAVGEMKASGVEAIGVVTDVSNADSVEKLARAAIDTYGAVHVLCNNAGVLGSSLPVWESSVADWQWTLGVNLWGVIHGLHTFLPIMLEQNEEGHVVNTASVSGLIPGGGIYGASKHAVVSLSETVYTQLKLRNAKVGISILCPGYVATRLIDSDRNRPAEFASDGTERFDESMRQQARERLATGLQPTDAAETVLKAIREDHFYILTHDEYDESIKTRMENILNRRNPGVPALG